MNKRLIVVSFSTSILLAYTSYSQTSSQKDTVSGEEQIELISKDSTIIPKETISIQKILLKGKSSSYSRYRDLAKEKERRKRIRSQYQKEKLLNK
jgi:hypothetical protein